MKKSAIIVFVILVLSACNSVKPIEPKVVSFPCKLDMKTFQEKANGIINYGGFGVVESNIKNGELVLIAQKLVSTSGKGDDAVSKYDQIRIRYVETEQKVWCSAGINTVEGNKSKFTGPLPDDAARLQGEVKLTFDRIFNICSSGGVFPNRE